MENKVRFTIYGKSLAKANCKTFAEYHQRVRLAWDGHEVVFNGNGENENCTYGSHGLTAYEFAPRDTDFEVEATFVYSETGQEGTFKPAAVVKQETIDQPDGTRRIEIRTEDGSDNDKNDTVLIIIMLLNATKL